MENDVGRAIAHLRYLLNDARRSETRIPLLKTDGQALLDHIAALEAEIERLRAALAKANDLANYAKAFGVGLRSRGVDQDLVELADAYGSAQRMLDEPQVALEEGR